MTQYQKEVEIKATKLEISAREELLRRLAAPMKRLEEADAKEQQKRRERVDSLSEYKTTRDVQDAYGYDMITEDEYRTLMDFFENGQEYIDDTVTPVNIAMRLLREYMHRISVEMGSLKFDLLPCEEQIRRIDESEKRRQEIEARRNARK